MVSELINGIYNSTAELYCQNRPFQLTAKVSWVWSSS